MQILLEKLHPILLVPAVVVLWLVGSTVLLFIMSAINVPGINEFGPGGLIAVGIYLLSIIGGLRHAFILLRRRHANKVGPT